MHLHNDNNYQKCEYCHANVPMKKKVNVFNVPEKKMMENCYVCLLSRGRFTFENVTRIVIYHERVIS